MIKNNDIELHQRVVTERFISRLEKSTFLSPEGLNINGLNIKPYEIPNMATDMDVDIKSDIKIITSLYKLTMDTVKGLSVEIDGNNEYFVKKLLCASIENINSLDDNVTRAFNMYYLVVSRHEDHNYTDMYIPFIIVTIDNTPYILLNKLSYTMSSNITGNVDNEWNYIKLVDGFVDNLVKNVLLDYTAADNTIIDIINGIRPGKYEFRYPGGDSRYLFILQENGYDPKVIELSKSGIYNNLPIVKFNADGSAIEQILVTDDFSIKSLSLGEYLQSNFKVVIFSATDGYFINNIEKNTVFMLNNTYYSVEDANYTYNDESNKYDLEVSVVKEGESHSFMEYDIMDLELQVILAENFSFGEASKPSMTEDEGDSKLNTNILKGDTRILYNRVKEGAKKLGAMTKKGGSKITEKTSNFVGDATYIKETNSLINDAWNLLMRIATSAALSVLLGPVIGLFIFICLQAKKVQFNSQLTVKKIEDTIQNKLDELEDKLAEAEENKNHDLANRYRRIITKTKAKLETVQKKIYEETDGAATSFEINRREKG